MFNEPILMIGAGGLGCEVLKNLVMMGFQHIDIVDMDTIEISNLNRQFFFGPHDVGRPKAFVAAEYLQQRFPGLRHCQGHHQRLQDLPLSFFAAFRLIVAGLDSIVARRWLNDALLQLLRFHPDGRLQPSSVVPWIDGGVEGLQGSLRVIVPHLAACFECGLALFPSPTTFPLCTLATRPRLPEHCIEWVRSIWWPQQKLTTSTTLTTLTSTTSSTSSTTSTVTADHQPIAWPALDVTLGEHVQLVYEQACVRAAQYGIQGVTMALTQRVLRHTIPAVAACNATVAGMMALEAFKFASGDGRLLDNFAMANAATGLYLHAFALARNEHCPACSSHVVSIDCSPDTTLAQLLERLRHEPALQLAAPSLRWRRPEDGSWQSIYFPPPSPLATATQDNLKRSIATLFQITASSHPMPITLYYSDPSRARLNNQLSLSIIQS